jgi:hypothetical protein
VAGVQGQFLHHAKGGNVVVFPGRAAEKPRQHIGQAKQPQGQPRQAADGRLGNDGWRGFIQNGWNFKCTDFYAKMQAKKKQPESQAAFSVRCAF